MCARFARISAWLVALLVITTDGSAFKLPSLHASITACMLLPRWETKNPSWVFKVKPVNNIVGSRRMARLWNGLFLSGSESTEHHIYGA